MANDAYIDDSYLQAQSEQDQQEFELYVMQQEYLIEQANKELRELHEFRV